MKFKWFFLFVFFVSDGYLVKTHELDDLTETTPEAFPFHAVVHSRMVCGGILIAESYVITPAYCVYGASKVTVYLGFRGYPYYFSRHKETRTQTCYSDDIFIHEDFAKLNNQQYLNNIALIKLSTPAIPSDKIQPGKLISREEFPLLVGKFANVSGWLVSKDENIKFATVQLRNQDTCSYLFGNQLLRSQEFCVKWLTKTRLNLLGNAVTVDDKIIGFQTNTLQCVVASSSCSRNDMVLNFIPFLNWISHKMDIPVEKFTSNSHLKSQECDNTDILIKIEHLTHLIDGTISREKNNSKKYNQDIAILYEKIESTIAEFQTIKNEQNNYALTLNEQIGDLKTEINNSRVQDDQNIFKLQEEINGARTEISSGLSAQKSLAELETKFQDLNNNLQSQINEQLNELESKFEDLLNTTESNKIESDRRFFQHENQIVLLDVKLEKMHNGYLEHKHLNNEAFGLINVTITHLSSVQNKLYKQIEDAVNEFKINKVKGHESLIKLQEQLNDIVKTVENNTLKENLRFNEIEKVFGEQRNDMDKHIIQDVTQIHSLWAEIRSLNATINKITDFFYADPYSN